jgi:hypothetical protein
MENHRGRNWKRNSFLVCFGISWASGAPLVNNPVLYIAWLGCKGLKKDRDTIKSVMLNAVVLAVVVLNVMLLSVVILKAIVVSFAMCHTLLLKYV